jgi:ABC-2 type transport system permease protein
MARTHDPLTAVGRRALRGERVRLGVVAAIAALYTATNVIGYRDTYPTEAARQRFAAAFGDNPALRLFYGVPHDLASVAGYAEFRIVGLLSVLVAGWAVFAAVRPLRGEEDDGRFELVLAGAVTRRGATAAVLAAVAVECGAIWLASAAGLAVTGMPFGDLGAGQVLLLATAITAPGLLFAAVAAVACQVAPTHRGAQAIGGAALALALLVRIAADLASGAGWARWATPLGWAEEARPVTGSTPDVYALFLVATVAVAIVAVVLAGRRDVGTGLAGGRRVPRSRMRMLGSTWQAAVRAERTTLLVWLAAAGVFAFVIGAFSKSIADEARRAQLPAYATQATTARGYLALTFSFFALVVALFATSHLHGIRDEEASGRLETLLALPVSRRRWLGGRLLVAAAATVVLALLVGLLAWAGAAGAGAEVGLASLLTAGANCIPAALLFLGAGALLFAAAPRLGGGGALALVGAAFLWELVGALVGAPSWALSASPFHHVAVVPLQAFDLAGALMMLIAAAAAAGAALALFSRRDLATG